MPPVSSNSTRRRSVSLQPKRCATPGRYQTGSIAALVTSAAPLGSRIWPSGTQAALLHGVDDLGQDHVRLGDGDGRADVVAGGQLGGEHVGHHGAPRVEADDLAGLAPLRVRADDVGGRGVGEVGLVLARQRARRHRQRPVHAVGAAVRADHVAMGALGGGADERAALGRRRRAPADRRGIEAAAVRGQADVAGGAVRPGGRRRVGAGISRHSRPPSRGASISTLPPRCGSCRCVARQQRQPRVAPTVQTRVWPRNNDQGGLVGGLR